MKRISLTILIGIVLILAFLLSVKLIHAQIHASTPLLNLMLGAGLFIVAFVSLGYNKKQRSNFVLMPDTVEDKLQKVESRVGLFFDYSVMGIAKLDLQGKIIQANNILSDVLKHPQKNLLGSNFLERLNPDDASYLQIKLQALILGTIPVYQTQLQCHCYNGEMVWANIVVSLVKNNDLVNYFLLRVEDITKTE